MGYEYVMEKNGACLGISITALAFQKFLKISNTLIERTVLPDVNQQIESKIALYVLTETPF